MCAIGTRRRLSVEQKSTSQRLCLRIVAARRAAVLVAALADRHEIRALHADAAERAETPAQRRVRASVDQQHLDTLRVTIDADRAVAQRRVDVALPGVARLEDVAVGVDGEHVADGTFAGHLRFSCSCRARVADQPVAAASLRSAGAYLFRRTKCTPRCARRACRSSWSHA
jgi:hypothetical protein